MLAIQSLPCGTDVLLRAPFDNTAASQSERRAAYLFNGTTGASKNLATQALTLCAGFLLGLRVAGVAATISRARARLP
jgi:hypothetical protein